MYTTDQETSAVVQWTKAFRMSTLEEREEQEKELLEEKEECIERGSDSRENFGDWSWAFPTALIKEGEV